MAMQAEQLSSEQLLLEIERLRQELEAVKRDKLDLEILLETTTIHADAIEVMLHQSNQQLQAEIAERQRAEAALQACAIELQSFLDALARDKADLEVLLETTTEHGDTVEDWLYNQAEEAVVNGEKRLAQFLDAVPVGVFVLDATGKPYYANKMAQQILGQESKPGTSAPNLPELSQIYVAGTNELYPCELRPILRALRGESGTIDDMEIRQGDKVIPLEVWANPIFDKKGRVEYAIAAFQDITDRKKAEAERRKFTSELFQLNHAFSRFVPRQFLQFLNKDSIVDVQLGDHVQKEMSVLFADIRDFTTLSESMTPEENFTFINAYLSRMEPAIVLNQGLIDKYIGDGIMALFSKGADNALKAAISMLQRLAEYNQGRAKAGYMPIQIGIGINTGSLMLGTVGGYSRMDSTVISDAVNLASRIEGLTKDYRVSLLISHHTFSQLQDANQYAFRLIDRVKVKGKLAAVSVYEIFDADPPKIRDAKLATKTAFEEALLLYNLHSFKSASQLFEECLHLNPEDTVAQIYLERCQRMDSTLRSNPRA
ncbi:adenylate/guanylate cyclase domain-containing protein [Allocoleopsis franciscana]|uniref:PAS domain S-box n=1 Tax=Allocoleopsis franciscana PCC 7113 TaxID=1173027 RepID=K9W8V6_9CYAN|nr:adenylate/guanylate cyclase domain-containing protein [Allocoleopsis franciscana]AFZ16648.1 PAS domain S-box [Allocoleopsis franciscana PCC 7113]